MDSRRRAIMGISKGRLPSGYQEVEYLESTGEQYIDSGINPSVNLDVEIVFSPKIIPATAVSAGIYGYRQSYQNTFGSQIYSDSNIYMDRGDSTTSRVFVHFEVDKKYKSINKETLRAIYDSNGNELARNTTQSSIIPTGSMWVFGYNGTTFQYFTGSIYNFKLIENETIIADFIPCYHKQDNKPGLYDLVNDVFYTNANTSATQDFIVGPNV